MHVLPSTLVRAGWTLTLALTLVLTLARWHYRSWLPPITNHIGHQWQTGTLDPDIHRTVSSWALGSGHCVRSWS